MVKYQNQECYGFKSPPLTVAPYCHSGVKLELEKEVLKLQARVELTRHPGSLFRKVKVVPLWNLGNII